MRLGFVGLGNLGGRLAARLVQAGHDVAVNDLDKARAAPLVAAGATWCDSVAGLAADAEAAFTCLPSPAAVSAVAEGDDGLLARLPAGAIWVDTSTNDVDVLLGLAGLAAERGVLVLEAPVTGGVHLAAAGRLTVIAGGDGAVLERCRPALSALGRRVIHAGPLGSATRLKVITNMLAFVHLVAAGEGLMLARRAGLDLATAFEALCASSGTSFVLETEGQLILNGSYDVGFTIDLALKDLGFATELAREHGVPLELEPLVERAFERARDAYGGGAWSTEVVRLLEDTTGDDLRAPGFPSRLAAG